MTAYTYLKCPSHAIAVLSPVVRLDEIRKIYLDPHGIPTADVKCIELFTSGKKTPVKAMKEFMASEAFLNEVIKGATNGFKKGFDKCYHRRSRFLRR